MTNFDFICYIMIDDKSLMINIFPKMIKNNSDYDICVIDNSQDFDNNKSIMIAYVSFIRNIFTILRLCK